MKLLGKVIIFRKLCDVFVILWPNSHWPITYASLPTFLSGEFINWFFQIDNEVKWIVLEDTFSSS